MDFIRRTIELANANVEAGGRPFACLIVRDGKIVAEGVNRYTLLTTVGGSCQQGSWSGNTYTTGIISGNCTVSFAATSSTYTVTLSADGNEYISPSSVTQTYSQSSSAVYTISPKNGYTISSVSGCGVTGSGPTYTIPARSSNCAPKAPGAITTSPTPPVPLPIIARSPSPRPTPVIRSR